MVFWFVADGVEFWEGRPWNKKTQHYIWTGEAFGPVHFINRKDAPQTMEFYVHPDTNQLVRMPQKVFKQAGRNSQL
jgi:hypothetical protein